VHRLDGRIGSFLDKSVIRLRGLRLWLSLPCGACLRGGWERELFDGHRRDSRDSRDLPVGHRRILCHRQERELQWESG